MLNLKKCSATSTMEKVTGLTFCMKFVSNYTLLTKITILEELGLLNKNYVVITIRFKNKKISTSYLRNLRYNEMYYLLLLKNMLNNCIDLRKNFIIIPIYF